MLAVAYYLISPLFITVRVEEAAPEQSSDMISAFETPIAPAQIIGTPLHPASGMVRIVRDNEKTYVRYEDFKTINGPDIFVYLAKDLDAKEYVNLGRVKATEGSVNYEVPAQVNVAEYRYVMVWCKAFDVLFNYAEVFSPTSEE